MQLPEMTRQPGMAGRPRLSPRAWRDLRNGLLFIAPWLVGLLVFTLYPILMSLYFSFTSYDVVSPPQWIGLDNYVQAFTADPLFYQAVGNTMFYGLISLPLSMLVAVGVSMLLNMKVRGLPIYRTLFFLPSIVPEVASAMLWGWILNPQFGLVNAALRALHLPALGWLSDPAWSKPALIMIGLWGFGGSMVIYLAALQDIPEQLYEAAELDGAGSAAKTWHVTLPMLTPTIFFNLILGLIGTFQYFTTAYVLTGGSGGPAGSTTFYAMLIYNNAFRYFKMGYASALAWILFAFVFVLTATIFKTSGRWVYYAGEQS
ncbi:MAG TPA: sugar ABC transporter permease [Roseiflexaceae bacterium]|nr:sugar ABC transporter permease [Roseiflexaceae bacterium]